MRKSTGRARRSGFGVGVLLACVIAWVLAGSAVVTAAGDPSAELKTAATHAGFAAKYETLKEVTLHLHHAVNCLVGPQDKLFDGAAGNPCQGQGSGYLPDLKASKGESNQYYEAWWAAQIAGQALTSNDLGSARAAAHVVGLVLADAAKAM